MFETKAELLYVQESWWFLLKDFGDSSWSEINTSHGPLIDWHVISWDYKWGNISAVIFTKDGVVMMTVVLLLHSMDELSELGPCSLSRSVLKTGSRNSFTISNLGLKMKKSFIWLLVHVTVKLGTAASVRSESPDGRHPDLWHHSMFQRWVAGGFVGLKANLNP